MDPVLSVSCPEMGPLPYCPLLIFFELVYIYIAKLLFWRPRSRIWGAIWSCLRSSSYTSPVMSSTLFEDLESPRTEFLNGIS